MLSCPKCGKRNPDDNKFCGECGTKLPAPENYCPKCKKTYSDGENFCTQCGIKLVNKEKCDKIPNQLINSLYQEFEDMNITTKSIYDLGDYEVLIILNDGTNLTDWDDVEYVDDILYISESFSNKINIWENYMDLTSVKAIIMSNVTDNVTDMKSMFANCESLVTIHSEFNCDFSNVTDMSEMFSNCESLVDISSLANWDVSNVKNMKSLFEFSNLKDISALSNWDVSNVKDMSFMFYGCESLMDISPLSNWNISSITDVSKMFGDEESLITDISSLNNWPKQIMEEIIKDIDIPISSHNDDNKSLRIDNSHITSFDDEKKLLNEGIQELKHGNYQDAEEALKKVLKINSKNDIAWDELCVLYHNLKDYPQALKAINHALEINSENDQYWFDKGNTLFWIGDFHEAIQCFDKAIELNPEECDDALAIKGMALLRLNKDLEGKTCLLKSLLNNPKNELALEAIKHTNALNMEIKEEDYICSSKWNLNPNLCANMRVIPSYINVLNREGININFEFNPSGLSRLTHNSKEYYFTINELEGAFAYISYLCWEECMVDKLDIMKS